MEHDEMDSNYYDVGCGESFSLNHIKNFIDSNISVSWDFAPAREGDARNTLANINPLKNRGWKPKIPLHVGLSRCFS